MIRGVLVRIIYILHSFWNFEFLFSLSHLEKKHTTQRYNTRSSRTTTKTLITTSQRIHNHNNNACHDIALTQKSHDNNYTCHANVIQTKIHTTRHHNHSNHSNNKTCHACTITPKQLQLSQKHDTIKRNNQIYTTQHNNTKKNITVTLTTLSCHHNHTTTTRPYIALTRQPHQNHNSTNWDNIIRPSI